VNVSEPSGIREEGPLMFGSERKEALSDGSVLSVLGFKPAHQRLIHKPFGELKH
jgi:hypothetical protein